MKRYAFAIVLGLTAYALAGPPVTKTGDLAANGNITATGTIKQAGNQVASIASSPLSLSGATVTLAGCASAGQVWIWNGTAFACGSAGISNSASANVITKSDGTNIVASSATDDGTTFKINTTALTVAESTGNTAVLGTLTADSGNRVYDAHGTGLLGVGNAIDLNMTGASCTAGQFVTAISSVGVGTCSSTAISGTNGDLAAFTGTNTIGNYAGASACSSGNFVTAISAAGATTCANTGLPTVSGTSGDDARFTATSTVGNSSSTDDGTTKTLQGLKGTECANTDTGVTGNTVVAASCTSVRFAPATENDFTGIVAPASGTRWLLLYNAGPSNLRLYHDNSNSTAANRFYLDNGASGVFVANAPPILIVYDTTTTRWRALTGLMANAPSSLVVNGSLSTTSNADLSAGQVHLGGMRMSTLSPSAISGTTNDWSPTGWTNETWSRIEVSLSAATSLSGMVALNADARVTLCNASTTYDLTLSNDAGSSAANRLYNGQGFDIKLTHSSAPYEQCATYVYGTGISRWVLESTTADTTGSHTFTSGLVVSSSGANLNSTTVTGTSALNGLTNFGSHAESSSTALTSSNLGSCGTGSPAIASTSTDTLGVITEGTTATGCTLTFAATYTVAPVCTCSGETSGAAAVLVGCHATATTLVIENASATGDKIAYHCFGVVGGT